MDIVAIPNREKRYWPQISIVTTTVGIDLQSWFISRFELARTGSGSQIEKSGRLHFNRWSWGEVNIDRWIRDIPRVKVAYQTKEGRGGRMLNFLDMNGLDERKLEIDGGGRFSRIKLHMLVVRKTMTQRTSHIYSSNCKEKDLRCRLHRKGTEITSYRKL